MPEITMDRALEIGENIKALVENFNAISEEELEEYIGIGRQKEAIDPLIDPTGWRDGYGKATRQTRKVFEAMLGFKRTVKGIGNFR